MEIKNVRWIRSGCLKCALTIIIPEWGNQEVDCTYFEKDNGSHWVNYAAREYMTKEGKKKSWNMCRWPQPVQERLTKAIHDKLAQMSPQESPPASEPTYQDEDLPF
jgi:hypothetical protein